jgi:hypothetical protein
MTSSSSILISRKASKIKSPENNPALSETNQELQTQICCR